MTDLIRRHVAVASVAVSQSTDVYRPNRGERVRVSLQKSIAAAGGASSTWSVGDNGSATRYVNATACTGASGDLVDSAVSSYLYGALGTISVVYTPGGGPGAIAPACDVILEVDAIWPQNV